MVIVQNAHLTISVIMVFASLILKVVRFKRTINNASAAIVDIPLIKAFAK
jgi:hypothetical protein